MAFSHMCIYLLLLEHCYVIDHQQVECHYVVLLCKSDHWSNSPILATKNTTTIAHKNKSI